MMEYTAEDGTKYPLVGTISWDKIENDDARVISYRPGMNLWYGEKAAADELGADKFAGAITSEMIAGMLVEYRIAKAMEIMTLSSHDFSFEVVNPRINVRIIRTQRP